ncbi:MAG: hypothetical protein ACFB2Y_02590 [Fulvivirga sp.]
MAIKRIKGFRKELFVNQGSSYGRVFVLFEGNTNETKFSLGLDAFLALSHILENDRVAYDTTGKKFVTSKELHLT